MFKVQQDMPPTKTKQLTKSKCISVMVHLLSWFIRKIRTFINTSKFLPHFVVGLFGMHGLPCLTYIHSFIYVSIGSGWNQVPQTWHQKTLFHLFYIYSPICISFTWAGTTLIRLTEQKRMWLGGKDRSCFLPLVLLLSFVCSCVFLFLFWSGCNPDCCN